MARIKGKDLYLNDDDQIYFGNNKEAAMWFKDGELQVNYTVSGIEPIENGHLVTKRYVDNLTVSGTNKIQFSAGNLLNGIPPAPDIMTAGPITGYAFDRNKDESTYGSFDIPSDWKSGTDITIKIKFMTDSDQTGTNTCRWGISYHSYSDGDLFTSKTTTSLYYDSTLSNNAPAGTFKDITFTSVMQHNDINNPFSYDKSITFSIFREGTHVNDTLDGDAIMGLLIFEYEYEIEIGVV